MLRHKIGGRGARPASRGDDGNLEPASEAALDEPATVAEDVSRWVDESPRVAISDDSLVNAKQDLADAVEHLVAVLRSPELRGAIPETDRQNLAKYLTIAKLKLENAIALVRSDNPNF